MNNQPAQLPKGDLHDSVVQALPPEEHTNAVESPLDVLTPQPTEDATPEAAQEPPSEHRPAKESSTTQNLLIPHWVKGLAIVSTVIVFIVGLSEYVIGFKALGDIILALCINVFVYYISEYKPRLRAQKKMWLYLGWFAISGALHMWVALCGFPDIIGVLTLSMVALAASFLIGTLQVGIFTKTINDCPPPESDE